MDTAEKILRKAMEKYINHTAQDFDEWMQEADYSCVIEAMKEYARQACKDQRQLCINVASTSISISDRILNAPEPELP